MNSQKFKQTEIELIFKELKNKGLINKKRKLVCNPLEANLRGNCNTIYYNPLFNHFKKDNLRLLLLHEEAHNNSFQNSTWILPLMIASYFCSYYLFKSFPFSILLFFVVFFLLRKYIAKDELNADLWAAKKLKEVYNIKKPSKIMNNAIKEFHKKMKKRNFLSKIFSKITKFLGYHPPWDYRVKLIRETVDNDN